MKKLLVLMLVLAMASLANAQLVFTLNGEPQPDEITILPSDIIELDLELAAGHNISGYQLMYQLNNSQAELIIDAASQDPPLPGLSDIQFPWASFFAGKVNGSETESGGQWVEITANNFSPATPTVLMTDMYLHCLEATDVILTICVSGGTVIDGVELELGKEMHTLTVHQVPEPMTIALLGLGGLFLRRRK